MAKTTASFRALREMCGLTQQNVADALGVRALTVKRWERPGFPEPPDDAWAYLNSMRDRMVEMAEFAADKAVELRDETGAGAIALTYFRDQSQYDEAGRDEGPVGFANAVARLTASHLEVEGVDVEFRYPDDGAVPTPGGRY